MELDPATAARVALSHAMVEQGLTKVAVASRIGKDEKAVRRMLAGERVSLDLLLETLRQLGVRSVLGFTMSV